MDKINYPANFQNEAYLGVSSKELFNIEVCGWKPKKGMPEYTRRLKGRADWQIIYIHDGYAYFQIENHVKKIGPYALVVFPPSFPQLYVYYPEECPIANFVHFSGRIASELMNKLNLTENVFYEIDPSYNEKIVEKFLNLQNKYALHGKNDFMYWGLFIDILTDFYLIISKNKPAANNDYHKYGNAVLDILEDIHNNYNSDYSVRNYAAKLNLSASYFAHVFKQVTGFSPIQYKNMIRISNAKNLLLTTTESIENISFELGYGNISVFSKKFKEATGLTPSAYRKSTKSKQ